jgi:fumarate reductase subunit C
MGVRRQAKRGNLMSSTQEMTRERGLVAGVGLAERPRKSRWPAKLDWAQSASGLLLGLFMWGHMFFVSSILISPDAMWMVTKAFEGYFFFGTSHPIIVSGVVAVVLALLVGHAALAMRKLPGSWKQLQTFAAHRRMLAHEDTTLWWVQALTGFALFFMATVHLYQMLMHPGAIGPYESAARVWHGWWPLYLVLLLAVELHGGIGLYRLAVKWGWFEGADPAAFAPPAAHGQVAADGLLPGAGPVHAAGLPAHRPGAAASREPRLHTGLAGQSAHGAGARLVARLPPRPVPQPLTCPAGHHRTRTENESHLYRCAGDRRRPGGLAAGHRRQAPWPRCHRALAGAAQAQPLQGRAGRHAGLAGQRDQG